MQQMRRIIIGMADDPAPALTRTAMMMMDDPGIGDAEKIDKAMAEMGKLAPSFNRMSKMMMDIPNINGNNLFTGDYHGDAKKIGNAIDTQEDWDAYWQLLGAKPPGPLPEGAVAIFQAVSNRDTAVTLEPLSVIQNGKDIMIAWNRVNIPREEMTGANSRYTVLLIPKGKLTASFMDSWPIMEERERQEMLTKTFEHLGTGLPQAISAPERAVFTKKYTHKPGTVTMAGR